MCSASFLRQKTAVAGDGDISVNAVCRSSPTTASIFTVTNLMYVYLNKNWAPMTRVYARSVRVSRLTWRYNVGLHLPCDYFLRTSKKVPTFDMAIVTDYCR